MTVPETVPVKSPGLGRVLAFDIARGLAIVGMICAHEITIENTTWPYLFAGITHGRSSALFALLAGISLGIMTGRTQPPTGLPLMQARMRIMVRALLLLVIGSTLEYFNVGIVLILSFYACWFFCSLPLLRVPPRHLLIGAGVLSVAGPVFREIINASVAYFGLQPGGASDHLFNTTLLTGVYSGVCYMVYILVGLALARIGLASKPGENRSLVMKTLLAGLILFLVGTGGGTAIASYQQGELSYEALAAQTSAENYNSAKPTDTEPMPTLPSKHRKDTHNTNAGFNQLKESPAAPMNAGQIWETFIHQDVPNALTSVRPHTNSTLETWGNLGFALMLVAGLLLAPPFIATIMRPVAALGSMALTAYAAHVVLHGLSLERFLPEALAESGIPGTIIIWLGTSIMLMIFALLWKRFYTRGPLEELLHRVATKATDISMPEIQHETANSTNL